MGAVENPEAVFLAKMTASATHELRNVLAVIKESAGLVEDLMLASQQQKPVNPEKLIRAAQRIDAQVGRGAELLTSLNRLAHGLDQAEEPLALAPHVRQIAFLCQRAARQRRARIEVGAGDGDRSIRANAMQLQMAMATAIECCLELLPEESLIDVQVAGTAEHPTVTFTGAATVPAEATPAGAPSWPRLGTLAKQVGAAVETTEGAFGFRLLFSGDGA